MKDVVQAALKAGERGNPGETYLITSKTSFEMDEIRRLVAKYLDIKKPYIYIPYPLAIVGDYSLETLAQLFKFTPIVTFKNIKSTVFDRVFSISKATNELGNIPEMNLDDGIKETILWYKDNEHL